MEYLESAVLFLLSLFSPDVTTPSAFERFFEPAKAELVSREVLDPRESNGVLLRPGSLADDLGFLWHRFRDVDGLPLTGEVRLFPPPEVVFGMWEQNRSFRRKQYELSEVGPEWMREPHAEAVREADLLFGPIEALRYAQSEGYYVSYRRQYLGRLRDLLGPEVYNRGGLPPPVPLHRFREIEK